MLLRLHPHLRIGLGLVLMAGVYATSVLVASSGAMHEQPAVLSAAIALDLTLTVAALAYVFLVRPGTVPAAALLPLCIAGLLTASRLIPAGQAQLLLALSALWAVVEASLAAVVLVRLGKAMRAMRAAHSAGLPLLRALATGFERALGHARVAEFLAQELAALYYGLAGWVRRPPAAVHHAGAAGRSARRAGPRAARGHGKRGHGASDYSLSSVRSLAPSILRSERGWFPERRERPGKKRHARV